MIRSFTPADKRGCSLRSSFRLQMRKLTDRELDLLVNGANSLASSWKLQALIEEIRSDPGVIEAGKQHGR